MQGVIYGNILSANSVKKDDKEFRYVTVLSGDDNVKVYFEHDTIDLFNQLSKLDRLTPVHFPVEISTSNKGNVYFNASNGAFIKQTT